MKEYFNLYIGHYFDTYGNFTALISHLEKLTRKLNWTIGITNAVMQNFSTNDRKSWEYFQQLSISFDKEGKAIYIGKVKKPKYIILPYNIFGSFGNFDVINKNILIIESYLTSNLNGEEFFTSKIHINSDIIWSLFNSDNKAYSKELYIYNLIDFLMEENLQSFKNGRKVNLFSNDILEHGMIDKDLNVVILPSRRSFEYSKIRLIPDNIFKEIFGSISEDFLKASNTKIIEHEKDLFVKDSELYINGKVILSGEHFQMADMNQGQLTNLIFNTDKSLVLSIDRDVSTYKKGLKIFGIFASDFSTISGNLGIMYVVNIKESEDMAYKPKIKKYNVILNDNQLTTEEI
jgi:hypothetical protein